MNEGMYISATGALANLARQDVIANNLANVNTTAFKPDVVNFRAASSSLPSVNSQLLLKRLGGGVVAHSTRTQFEQGILNESKSQFDIAINGSGFLVAENQLLTRDGRLALNQENELVMASTGYRILDDRNRPIRINDQLPVQVDTRGSVTQENEEIANLQFVDVAHPEQLSKDGDNLYRFTGSLTQNQNGELQQGFVEASAVDPIASLYSLIETSKALQANITMLQYHDHALGSAINTFGRVA